MTLTLAELDALREGWDFEVKTAAGRDGQGKLPDDFWPTCSAMANTHGGRVMLGVSERADHSLQVRGLGDPHKVETELWNLLQNPQKVSVNLLSREDLRIEELAGTGGKRILVLDIPQAPRNLRPVHLGPDPFTGTWYRVHEGDRRADRERVRRMIADADPEGVDSRVLEHFTLDDLDPASIRRFRTMLSDRRPAHPFLQQEGLDFLRQIRAWGQDRERGVEGPTLAGLLLLGRENAIRDRLDAFHLDYRELAEPGAVRWVDRVWPDGTWNANLLGFYQRVLEKLHDRLPVPFRLGPDLHRRDETPVHEALREALVNALIHADYTTGNGIRVFREPGRFRFINPGSLLLPLDQIRAGGESACRNRTLQHLFVLIGAGERAGSGFPTILSAWREQHWRLPALREDVEKEETSLHLTMESLLPEAEVGVLVHRLGEAFTGQDELGRIILVTAEVEGEIDHARITELSSAHSRDITLKLQELLRRGLLARAAGPGGHCYRPAHTARPALPLFSARTDASPATSDPSSATGDASSTTSDPSSTVSDPSSTASDPSSGHQHTPPPPWLTDAVHKVRHTKKTSPEVLDQAIVDVCVDEFLDRDAIAQRVGRAVNTLRARYLPRLVQEGRLVLRFPDRPTHKDQAYRAAPAERGGE